MGVTVTTIFGICWAPNLFAHNLDLFTPVRISELAYTVSHMLVLFNSAVNPFVYALVNKNFRQKLKETICYSCDSSTGSARIRVFQQYVSCKAGIRYLKWSKILKNCAAFNMSCRLIVNRKMWQNCSDWLCAKSCSSRVHSSNVDALNALSLWIRAPVCIGKWLLERLCFRKDGTRLNHRGINNGDLFF